MRRETYCLLLLFVTLLLPGCVKVETEGGGVLNPHTPSLFRKVESAAILPFSYYSDKVTVYERMKGETPGYVMDAVASNLLLRGVKVADRDEVNVRLMDLGIVHPLKGDQELLPTSLPHDIASYDLTDEFKEEMRLAMEESESRPDSLEKLNFPETEKVTREDLAKLGYMLKSDLIIMGRIVEHSGEGKERRFIPYTFIPKAVGNLSGVAYTPHYENRLSPGLGDDIRLIKKRSIWEGVSVSKYSGIALRIYAFDAKNGGLLWSNGAVITYSTLFDPPIDVVKEKERLRRLVDEKVSLLVGDLLK